MALVRVPTKRSPLDLQVVNNGLARAQGPFCGTLRVSKDPGNGERHLRCGIRRLPHRRRSFWHGQRLDEHLYLQIHEAGLAGTTLAMYALPHHQTSFDGETRGKMTSVKLQTTTKGMAVAVVSDTWTMIEQALPVNMGFLPWSPKVGGVGTLSTATKNFIRNIAVQEVSQNILEQTNQNSMYFEWQGK